MNIRITASLDPSRVCVVSDKKLVQLKDLIAPEANGDYLVPANNPGIMIWTKVGIGATTYCVQEISPHRGIRKIGDYSYEGLLKWAVENGVDMSNVFGDVVPENVMPKVIEAPVPQEPERPKEKAAKFGERYRGNSAPQPISPMTEDDTRILMAEIGSLFDDMETPAARADALRKNIGGNL